LSKDDFDASVATLRSIGETLDASCVQLRQREIETRLTAQFLVRKRAAERDFTEIR
jgi:GTPase